MTGTRRTRTTRRHQSGTAILLAMLIVTLVASLSAAALWHQWRSVEIEVAERARLQSTWILQGAQDWARLILREDSRTSDTDHLGEPWAIPLQEIRLTTFLAQQQNTADIAEDLKSAYLSGQITDLQSRMNVRNLVQAYEIHKPTLAAFRRLFALLRLPEQELDTLVGNLRAILETPSPGDKQRPAAIPLLPQTLEQLTWLGLSPTTIQTLQPFITLLPEPTPININTAPALVLAASLPDISQADAQRLVLTRSQADFKHTTQAAAIVGIASSVLENSSYSVASNYFEIKGRMRLGDNVLQAHSVVHRQGLQVQVLWHARGAHTTAPPPVAAP